MNEKSVKVGKSSEKKSKDVEGDHLPFRKNQRKRENNTERKNSKRGREFHFFFTKPTIHLPLPIFQFPSNTNHKLVK